MKFIAVALAAAGIVAAQSESDLPTCAQSCLTGFISGSDIAGCGRLEIACICSNSDFISSISCCLVGACSAADQQASIDYAASLCNAQGVTVPSTVSCSSTSSGATASASSSATGGSNSTVSTTTSSGSSATSATATGQSTTKSSSNAVPTAGVGLAAGVLAAVALL